MTPARIYVGCSSSDNHAFELMRNWEEGGYKSITFCRLPLSTKAIDTEQQLKNECRLRLSNDDTFLVLIGKDTWYKYKCVNWQAEVAIEKGCRLIVVNLDNTRVMNENSCPQFLVNAGALFVPFSSKVIAYAMQNFQKMASKNYYYDDHIYSELGV